MASWRGTSTVTAAPTWPSPTPFENDVSVLLGNGDGTFQNQVTYAVGSGPDGIVAGDFNGDGRTDLAVANRNSNDVSVLLGNGDGTFTAPGPSVTTPRPRPSWQTSPVMAFPMPLSSMRPGTSSGEGAAARAGHVRSARDDQPGQSLAGHRRRGHEPGPGARQRRRHRRRGLVVRLARRRVSP